ncbi:fructose-specific PTS transporter subunit EIIC [Streptomyces sp. XM4193]|uniref:fructose-specific PTS transporter subunit EIIC n=1 Tax=Streptomyces sp. XM4193 TaxID=2929782 RepID=UPI001FFA16CD|nr:fructose-specific PTS transporter subunit EIIC [Streptomyces sp. XM4193]
MAAEKLTQAAQAAGISVKVETQGSIGAENALSDNDVSNAEYVIIAADKEVDLDRFTGKRVLAVGVSEGISHPEQLIERVRTAPVHRGGGSGSGSRGGSSGGAEGGGRSLTYKALMNGVSYMIPFVVVGGLLIALSLAIGGQTSAEGGLVIPDGSYWQHVNDIGVIGFQLMVPILSGYIAYAIGDRPALAPGMIAGWIVNEGSLYDSEAGAGFIGAIVTGFLAGHLVRLIKKVRVPKFAQPIMPIIVIPIFSTVALGLFVISVIGRPIAWVFETLTEWLGGMTGTNAIWLGALLGLMIAFDMGGPVNKTAFLFGAGLIESGNLAVMGMCAAAIPVMPLGQGLATLVRRRLYDDQERETGMAALFMGFFGISEGAIPFAAARPAQVIPANMLGGAVAGGIAGLAGVTDAVPHGGPIVAVLQAVGGVPMFFVAVIAGTLVTALATVTLVELTGRRGRADTPEPAKATAAATAAAGVGASTGSSTGAVPAAAGRAPAAAASTGTAGTRTDNSDTAAGHPTERRDRPEGGDSDGAEADPEGQVLSGHLTAETVGLRLEATERDAAIGELAALLARTGRVRDQAELVRVALAREEQGSTGLGEEIAVPHAKTDAVTAPVVGFSRSPEGIDWNSVDGTRARLIFMIAVPEAAAGDEHLRILAQLSRKLMDGDFRERLQSAPDTPAVLAVLREIG